MTLLILGDSFADRMNRNYPWCDILSDILEEPVDNYGLGGTAIEYSYDLFLEHYSPDKYDKVVFIVTDEMRHFYKDLRDNKKQYFNFHGDRNQSILQLGRFNKISDYWIKPEDITRFQRKILIGQELIHTEYSRSYSWKPIAIEDSLRYRVKGQLLILTIEQLMKVQKLDYDKLRIEGLDTTIENKNRPNHLSITQSKELANYIARYFKDGFDIYQTFEDAAKYYTISKTKEEAGFK